MIQGLFNEIAFSDEVLLMCDNFTYCLRCSVTEVELQHFFGAGK